jgi:hypothetical protein
LKHIAVLILISLTGLSGVQLKAAEEPTGQACMYQQYLFCIEGWSANGNADCEKDGGVVLDQCPTENRIATCRVERDGREVFTRYYEGTRINPMKICKAAGGVYIPG